MSTLFPGETLDKISNAENLIFDASSNLIGIQNPRANGADLRISQFLGSFTWTSRPDATLYPGATMRASDVGIAPGMRMVSDGTRWIPDGVQVLARGAIPMIIPSSGTIGNNGALSAITALPNTYLNCYMYFPADAIAVGVAAGLYYVVLSSTTAGTIYNNTYTSGSPSIPASPTPFVTTGPGAYTQTTGADISLLTVTIPGNLMGIYGGVRPHSSFINNNSGGAKTARLFLGGTGGTTYSAVASTTNITATDFRVIENRGVANRQAASFSSAWSGVSAVAGASVSSSIDTTADTTLVWTGQLAVATDYCLFNTVMVESLP